MYRLNDYGPNIGGLSIMSGQHPQNTMRMINVLTFVKIYLPIFSSGEFAERPRLKLK